MLGLYLVLVAGLAAVNRFTPHPTHAEEAVFAESREPHLIMLQDSGMLSFRERLRLIESARKTLELEFFIYNVDEASRILTRALIARAEAGVKIRVLVDFSAPVFQLKPVYARYLKAHGIEVRYYNTSAFYRLIASQHRSHRKLLIADGGTVITGGRNIANEYFDLSPEYDFLDTDVELSGPLVASVRRSFELYWSSDFSAAAPGEDRPLDEEERALAESFLRPRPADEELRRQVEEIGGAQAAAAPRHECRDLTFVTDFPNQGEANRRVYRAIVKEIAAARASVEAESPYFVIRGDGYDDMRRVAEKGVRLSFLTNGLYSTDATYTVASLFYNLRWLAKTGMSIFSYAGAEPTDGQASGLYSRTHRWGLHSKRAVIDGETSLIGTYNIDPRSANLNSELMIICRGQRELAAEMLAHMHARRALARPVAHGGKADLGALIAGATWGQKMLLAVLLPISNLFDFLL